MAEENPTEEDIMQGHPAQEVGDPFKEEKPPQEEPKGTKKLNIGGKDVELPEDTAAAIESYSQQVQSQMQQLQQQNQQLYNYLTEKEVNQGQQQSKPSSGDDIDEDLLYENPKEFIRRVEERVASRVGNQKEEVLSEVQKKSQQEKSLQQFWDGFWKQHSDLDPNRDSVIVNSVFNQKAQEWGSANLTFGQVQDRLADEARKIIARYQGSTEDDNESGGNFSETPSSNSRAKGKAQGKKQQSQEQTFSNATELLKNIRNKKGI